jgi:hypothetical protein
MVLSVTETIRVWLQDGTKPAQEYPNMRQQHVRWLLLGSVCTALSSCVHGYYWPAPAQYQGEFVVNSVGATLYSCDIGPGWVSGSTPGLCFETGNRQCADCIPVAPGTPVRILHTYVFESTDITLAVGTGAQRKVAHMSVPNWDKGAQYLLPGLSRPERSAAKAEESCPHGALNTQGPWRASMVDYGQYTATLSSDTAAGPVASDRQLQRQTDQVAATIGADFGFRYRLTGPDAGTFVTIHVDHPAPLRDPATGKSFAVSQWSQWVPANQINWNTGFLFQHDWEIVPGEWIMRLCVDNAPLLEQRFVVHDARRGESARADPAE